MNDIGPYRILRELGRGGMGVVYQGRHRDSGQQVAIKTVLGAAPKARTGLRLEVASLAAISHPQVVAIVDEGVADPLPWYAMEMVHGAPLRHYLASMSAPSEGSETTATFAQGAAPSAATWQTFTAAHAAPAIPHSPARPPVASGAIGRVLQLARDLCEPLAWLHGEGVVHRDLKPDNIIVRLDGLPVIVDFGLTGRFAGGGSRETLDGSAMGGGTLAYIAPEQLRGELVDARADIYAFGCLLFEMLTGRPPFSRPSAAALIQAHQHEPPPRLDAFVTDAPARLDALIQTMLAKEPRDRVGYANDVASALEALGATPTAHAPQARTYLYRPHFVGRSSLLSALQARLRRVDEGPGVSVLLGPSGVGKTRLALQLRHRAPRQLQVLLGSVAQTRRAGVFAHLRPVFELASDRCRRLGPQETERLFGDQSRELARFAPELRGLPGQQQEPEPPDLPAELVAARRTASLRRVLTGLAAVKPLWLVLDDLQWTDPATAALLTELHRRPVPGLWVLGTARVEDLNDAQRDWLAGFGDYVHTVDPLQAEDLDEVVGSMLAMEAPPPDFVRFLAAETEGNPLFLVEYLHAAVRAGVLTRPATCWILPPGVPFEDLGLPVTLHDLLAQRLGSLQPAQRAMVLAAAVLGRRSERVVLAKMIGSGTEVLLTGLAQLAQHQVLHVDGDAVVFEHDKLREVALARLASNELAALHHDAAEALEALERSELGRIASHRDQAGEHDAAVKGYLQAAEGARASHDLDNAVRFLCRVLELRSPPSSERLQAGLALVAIYERQGHISAMLKLATRLLPEATEEPARGSLMLARARAAHAASEPDWQAHLAPLLDHADPLLRGRAWLLRAWAHQQRGDLDAAEMAVRQSEVLLADDPRHLPEAHARRGAIAYGRGQVDEALASFERAAKGFAATGQVVRRAHQLANLGATLLQRGSTHQAIAILQQAREVCQRCGDRHAEAMNSITLGVCHRQLQQLAEAVACIEEAVQIGEELGDPHVLAQALVNLGFLLPALGRLPAARQVNERALALTRAHQKGTLEVLVLRNCALAARLSGNPREALAFAREALEAAAKLTHRITLIHARFELAFCLLATGEPQTGLLEEMRALTEGLGTFSRRLAELTRALACPAHERRLGLAPEDIPAALVDSVASAAQANPQGASSICVD